MKVYFINSVYNGNKQLLSGTFATREEAEERIKEIKGKGLNSMGNRLEVEEFTEKDR